MSETPADQMLLQRYLSRAHVEASRRLGGTGVLEPIYRATADAIRDMAEQAGVAIDPALAVGDWTPRT
jgi:hypothetical protein